MAKQKLKKYNIDGKETGEIAIDPIFEDAKANKQMIKDYIVAIRKNARQWSASTKTRKEVKHTTKKPHPQKGTGRARQGSLVAPQFKGGGIVHGPKPKFDQHVRINQKERKSAIRYLIAEMMKNGNVIVFEEPSMEKPQTKTVANFLQKVGLEKRVLFIGEGNEKTVETEGKTQTINIKCDQHDNFMKSLRNLDKVEFALAKNLNGYNVMVAKDLVITEKALEEVSAWLS